jgi:hypothetical protein
VSVLVVVGYRFLFLPEVLRCLLPCDFLGRRLCYTAFVPDGLRKIHDFLPLLTASSSQLHAAQCHASCALHG